MPPEPQPFCDALVLSEEPRLRSYLKQRLKRHEDIEDYIQDVYARVLATPPKSSVENWQGLLRRIASNLIIDRARSAWGKVAAKHVPLDDDWDQDDERPSAEHALIMRERLAMVSQALEDVSTVARSVFLLVRVEGLTHREAAERLGLDTKTAGRHVERALLLISRRLAERLEA